MSDLPRVPDAASSLVRHRTSSAPALLIRSMDGHIVLWSREMVQRYGFTFEQARRRLAHRLLKTIFWKPLHEIQATLLAQRTWTGGLIHHRSDGSLMVTTHFWHLHLDPAKSEPMVAELHSDVVVNENLADQLADIMAIAAREFSEPMTAIGSYIGAMDRMVHPTWPHRQRLTETLSESALQVERVKHGIRLFREIGEALRTSTHNANSTMRAANKE